MYTVDLIVLKYEGEWLAFSSKQ